ncbi:MAG: nicotinate phosphoribosyltransferase [Balneolaceae bacterium]
MYIDKAALFTDYYELTMAQGYFLQGKHNDSAVFDYFFRKNPFNGGFVVFAGLEELIETVINLRFDDEALQWLAAEGFHKDFIAWLSDFQFRGSIRSAREGDVVFPNQPVLIAEGPLLDVQIIETLLLNILNYQSLVATKAARMRYAAGPEATLLDFGLRRAQGLGGIHATRSAIIGGFNGTSNVYAAHRFGVSAGGTMAHSWIQSFDSEIDAFRAYAQHFPDQTILLVDTYDTLKSGIPNAITVADELQEKGHQLKAVRLDSGDLAYLSKKSRDMLDTADHFDVKIAVSNQLDEKVIASLIAQGAPIDIFGVGTQLVTGGDSPALDGVYKLAECNGTPRIKISDNVEKITLPGRKTVRRYTNPDGTLHGDAIGLLEDDPFDQIHDPAFPARKTDVTTLDGRELLTTVIQDGKRQAEPQSIGDSANFVQQAMRNLTDEYKRFENPHIYKVGVTRKLLRLRNQLIEGQ